MQGAIAEATRKARKFLVTIQRIEKWHTDQTDKHGFNSAKKTWLGLKIRVNQFYPCSIEHTLSDLKIIGIYFGLC
ncbi:MAG: hypothetical protein ACXWT1_13080 [Methylobacter sp.]